MKFFILIIGSLITICKVWAFTSVQTSTSVGVYRDYIQNAHYPIYHSWSVNGIYENGTEASIEFYLNNDFALNQWLFLPTQAQINIPLSGRFAAQPERQSKVKLGRQLFMEGFDFSHLDGVQVPLYWSVDGGLMPIAGYLQSPDPDQSNNSDTPILGLVAWERLGPIKFRAGYNGRETDFTSRYLFASARWDQQEWVWQPSLIAKQEWDTQKMQFNQASTDLVLNFTEFFSGRIGYANLEPRPLNKLAQKSYVYRLFAVTPTETLSSDLNWSPTENLNFNIGAQRGYFNSGYKNETSNKQEASLDYQLLPGHWLSPSLIHLSSYGGEVSDIGLRYVFYRDSQSKYQAEANMAYVKKINQIEGWAQHLRGGYETLFSKHSKVFFAAEGERNQYYVFDLRVMAYVTNYL